MASILPPFPRFVMTVFEPISLIAGAVAPFISPEFFVAEQIPGSPTIPLTDNATLVAYQVGGFSFLRLITAQGCFGRHLVVKFSGKTGTFQSLGNIYFLLALVGVAVLYTTSESKVVRNYVIALWIVDVTHIIVSGYGLGLKKTLNLAQWNAVTWGNMGVTAGLCITRTLYLTGFFGHDERPGVSSTKKSH